MKTSVLPHGARSRAVLFTLLAAPSLIFVPQPGQAAAARCGATYTVRPGDSLSQIAATCGIAPSTIVRLNRLGRYLYPRQVLQLTDPFALHSYVVQPGDTLIGVARHLGTTPSALARINRLANADLLRAHQVLRWRRAATVRSSVVRCGATHVTQVKGLAFHATVAAGSATYRVRPGDTLWGVARSLHTSETRLAQANHIANLGMLRAGAILRVPTSSVTAVTAPIATRAVMSPRATGSIYRVQAGDTLSGIALSLGVTVPALARLNGLDVRHPIQVGQTLRYGAFSYNAPSTADIGAMLNEEADIVGVERSLLQAVAWRESSWRMVDARDGGIGVMQLMPDTVHWLKATYLPGRWNPHHLRDNVHAGAVLLSIYSRFYANDVAKITAAFHGGMGAVGPHESAEMHRYIRAVMAYRHAFMLGGFPS